MTLPDIHSLLGTAFMYFTLFIAVWALYHLIGGREIGGDFWGAVAIGEGLIALQTVVGVILLLRGAMPLRTIHFLYGGVALITWPAVFAFTRGDTTRRAALFWLLFSLFLFGIALRAMSTAGANGPF